MPPKTENSIDDSEKPSFLKQLTFRKFRVVREMNAASWC